MIFTMADLKKLDPAGTGTISDRHKKLFPEPSRGTAHDRESRYLSSRGIPRSVGTLQDRWRKFFGIGSTTRLSAGLRSIVTLDKAGTFQVRGCVTANVEPKAASMKA